MLPTRAWGRRPAGRPLVIAHRGASARETENTVAAFERAARDGADGVELDVLLCRSGEVVVFHDDDLRRLGGRPERVGDLSLRALRRIDLRGGGRIPTLEEAIAACGPGLLVNIELKAQGAFDRGLGRLADGVAGGVERSGAGARVLVSSFEPAALVAWKRGGHAAPAAFLFDASSPGAVLRILALPWLAPSAVHPEHPLCTPPLLARWHALGYAVNTWTADDPARLRALAAMGADGIITNDPAGAREALAPR
jgi:glycerophosphoryl diester phosphodiesterase